VRKLVSIPLTLALGAFLHVDWHLARPLHDRLSLDWSSHWIACGAAFGLAAVYIARRWPGARWQAATWNVAVALLWAQVVEPLLEAAFYLQIECCLLPPHLHGGKPSRDVALIRPVPERHPERPDWPPQTSRQPRMREVDVALAGHAQTVGERA
jgi:hypothetical protein